MNRKDLFQGTVTSNIKSFLDNQFNPKSNIIYENALEYYEQELATSDFRNSHEIKSYLVNFILPTVSIYKALIKNEITEDIAYNFLLQYWKIHAEQSSKMYHRLTHLPFFFNILKVLIFSNVERRFPKKGWHIIRGNNNSKEISFHFTRCLFCEEFKKRNLLHLCSIFCHMDVINFSGFMPKVEFKRNNTIANGGECCDFCFKLRK